MLSQVKLSRSLGSQSFCLLVAAPGDFSQASLFMRFSLQKSFGQLVEQAFQS